MLILCNNLKIIIMIIYDKYTIRICDAYIKQKVSYILELIKQIIFTYGLGLNIDSKYRPKIGSNL